MRKVFHLLILILLSSCNLYERKEEVFITDNDFVENYREYSPDSSMVLINYSIDLGAFGYGYAGTAILKAVDTTKNLREYTLANDYTRVKWIDNKNISAQFDILPSIRAGLKVKTKNFEINNILIHVSALDYIDQGAQQIVEYREVSPNGLYELVVYRYLEDRDNFKFIHISLIKFGEQIPKYGNYFIADTQSDYIFYGTWTKSNELEFYSNSQFAELIPYYLVENRPKVNFRIITDDKKYGKKYRSVQNGKLFND